MFVINIRYTVPAEVVAPFRQQHIEWLERAVASGVISVAGSKATKDGGVLLSSLQDRDLLVESLAQDPYTIHDVADQEIIEVGVPLVAGGLELLKTPQPEDFDVVIVGYGPVGRVLALQLGRRGHKVAVVERKEEDYALPRAVHFDDEIARILQAVGASPEQLAHALEPYDDLYEWRSANGDPLLRLEWRGGGPSGWNTSYFFHQPSLEAFLDEKVERLPNITVLRGWEAESRAEAADNITLHVRHGSGERRSVRGRYLVGADGASSKVRKWMDTPMTDLGYFYDWLVIDLLPKEVIVVDPPALQICDPLRPTTLVPGGPGRRRFEFMRLEGEDKAELGTEARAWELMSTWGVTPETAEIERHTIYTFAARWCDQWRRGRMLLAGDSAHQMPPFAGQGMSSGIRDAANLEWKLDRVLNGSSDASILDTYGTERTEHVRHFIDRSMELGEVICITDEKAAADRDERMVRDLADGVRMPAHPAPRLGAGLYRSEDALSGTLAIQAQVRGPRGEGLFDDVFGSGGVLLLKSQSHHATLPAPLIAELAKCGIPVICFGDAGDEAVAEDVAGSYAAWFGTHHAEAILVREDNYVFGVATEVESISALGRDFVAAVALPQLGEKC